ncbi:MAG: histidinol dehydrogenase [Planctomycetaceae bacterium]
MPARCLRICEKLSPRGDAPRSGRRRTVELFGVPLSPQQVVERICSDVRTRGLEAVLDYSRRIDGREMTPETLRVSASELLSAHAAADPVFLDTLRRIRANIVEFQRACLVPDAVVRVAEAAGTWNCGSGGCRRAASGFVCRGAAAYPSTVLMTAVPAQVAGVPQIAVVVPPTEFGGYNADLLATCHELGLTEVYRIGGAQESRGWRMEWPAFRGSTRSSGRGTCLSRSPSGSYLARSTSTASPVPAKSCCWRTRRRRRRSSPAI